MRPQQGDALRPTACPISCRLARALPCSTARIFLSSRSIGWIIHQSSTTQKIILRFTPFEANSANSSHPPRAYFFHHGALGIFWRRPWPTEAPWLAPWWVVNKHAYQHKPRCLRRCCTAIIWQRLGSALQGATVHPHQPSPPLTGDSMQLTKLVVGLSLALGFVATAAAQTTMRISISTAQNSHQGIAIDTFAKEVEKRTAGRYKVQTFYNGALGGERESIEAVQLGTQELATQGAVEERLYLV